MYNNCAWIELIFLSVYKHRRFIFFGQNMLGVHVTCFLGKDDVVRGHNFIELALDNPNKCRKVHNIYLHHKSEGE